ncbi:MAG: MOSC domain-containing protein [Nocardioidaceae bacterium]|nr:MOSC domain-containing protein [Nocardioidaceae bacterium]
MAAVATNPRHGFSKDPVPVIRLVAGYGVEGDAHAGETVQHLSRVRRDPSAPNLRQVHLIQAELFDDVAEVGFAGRPGQLGENVTTTGVDLLALPTGTVLLLGRTAEVRLTGLRNPCRQIDAFQHGLLAQVLGRDADGAVVRRAGVMAVVQHGGEVRPGDLVTVVLPDGEHRPLDRV